MSARPEDVIRDECLRHIRESTYGRGYVLAPAILSALRTADFVIEQGWQPIETAPRDAILLLGHVEDTAPLLGYYHRGAWREHNGKGTICKPTHWRPLPTPPEGQP